MIYLVLFEIETEPSVPVRAFTSEVAARGFQAQLVEYDSTFNDVDDTEEAEELWKAQHPAGPKCSLADYWTVCPVPVDDE
jgi:hypothetical protein